VCSSDLIIEQVLAQIASGILIHDDALPGIRTMAKDLGINPNTVVKAYTELEREGFVYSLTGKGYYVSTTEKDHSDLMALKLSELRKDIEKEIVDVALVAAKRLMEDKVDIDHDRLQVQQIIKDVRN